MDNSGFNIAEMNDETLQYLLSACEKEMQARKNKDKERKWKAVRTAIANYVETYGDIVCSLAYEDDFRINLHNIDFDTIGVFEERDNY